MPRHSDLGGQGNFDADALDPNNPFTGNGYTSGGIPEFRTGGASDLDVGVRDLAGDKFGNQHLVANLRTSTAGWPCR